MSGGRSERVSGSTSPLAGGANRNEDAAARRPWRDHLRSRNGTRAGAGRPAGRMRMASVEVIEARKSYGSVEVVHGVSMAIADGEFVMLVGPSGCGKSTLLRMIAGLEGITGGEITIGDARGQRSGAERARHRHGVPELCALPAHDRRREHGLRPEAAQDAASAEIDSRVARGRRDPRARRPISQRYPRQLSGGQRQRVAMGRAIVRDPAGVPVRRAALQPRRQAARADARRDQGTAPAARRPRRSTSPTTRSRP